jgi:hypothetical protein
MSSKLVKQPGHIIELPNDKCVVNLKIFASGTVQLQAPEVSPTDLCKLLNNVIVDVTYAALSKSSDTTKIDTSQGREAQYGKIEV